MSTSDLLTLIVAILALLLSAVALIRTEWRERERLGRERATFLDSRSGEPTTEFLGRNGRALKFRIKNVGQKHMSDIKPFLIDFSENTIAEYPSFIPGLSPDKEIEFEILAPASVGRKTLKLRYSWYDTAGQHVYTSKVPTR